MTFKVKAAGTFVVPDEVQEPVYTERREATGSHTAKGSENRFYLPVLNINNAQHWPSKPLDQREKFTDEVAYKTCLGNCCGVEGLKAACCHIDPDDLEHVLGPCRKLDEAWIQKCVVKLNRSGMVASRSDVVIDFEEGKVIGEKFFNSHPIFNMESSYPMLRFQVLGPRFACKFLNPDTKKCTIYSFRPNFCQSYLCSYISGNFLVKTPEKPNTWQKLR